jgi:hypothetical protein
MSRRAAEKERKDGVSKNKKKDKAQMYCWYRWDGRQKKNSRKSNLMSTQHTFSPFSLYFHTCCNDRLQATLCWFSLLFSMFLTILLQQPYLISFFFFGCYRFTIEVVFFFSIPISTSLLRERKKFLVIFSLV